MRRAILPVAMGAVLVAATATTAQGTDDPLAGVDAAVRRTATTILGTAPPGKPLKVVVTTRTADGPRITTRIARSSSNALELIASALSRSSTVGVDMAQPVHLAATNDTYRSRQWALTRFGAETLWKKSTGSGVVVAVVDTGVTASHPDLQGHVLAGRDFVAPGTAATDQNGHGTHVAGIIAAIAGNGRGIAGLARYSRILPVRVLDASGSGDSADVANGIVWAVKHGARVINLSLTATHSDSAGRAAVAYALSKNVVVVAAAGNNSCSLLGSPTTYPAAYDGVLGVGAIASDGSVASYSNCGRYVDVVAPGSSIVSTMISHPAKALGCPTVGYCYLSGTSMAAPYASATAALEISHLGAGWKQSTVRSLMQSTADDIGSRGYDTRSGYGVINPGRMLAAR